MMIPIRIARTASSLALSLFAAVTQAQEFLHNPAKDWLETYPKGAAAEVLRTRPT